jgi:protein TonB
MFARTAEKRSLGALGRMGVVVAFHAALIFLVARGLGIVPPLVVQPPDIETAFIDEPRPADPVPQIEDPRIEQQDIWVPEPVEPVIENETPPPDVIMGRPLPPEGVPEGPGRVEPEGPVLMGVRVDPRRPVAQPMYPASLIRQGIEGFVEVEVLVQPSGRVSEARIVRSSGQEAFERATLDEARRTWRLLPATRDGVPYPKWYTLRVSFQLKDQR